MFVALIFCAWNFQRGIDDIEISEQSYFELYNLYEYKKGSQVGKELKFKINRSAADSKITVKEYEEITGSRTSPQLTSKPEMKNIYQEAKRKVLML